MARYARMVYPAAPVRKARPTSRPTPARPTPHREHQTWNDSCERCQAQMIERTAQIAERAQRSTARIMREAPGYGR